MTTATTSTKTVKAGVTITAGQAVYKDSTDSDKYKLADATDATEDDVDGIAMTNSSNNQPLVVAFGGSINLGATLIVGEIYLASANAPGGIMPIGDLSAGEFATILGIATSAALFEINFFTGSTARA